MNTDAIVFLLRKTNLTREGISELTYPQFIETVKEVNYQESVEEYNRQFAIATILAAIYNTIPRKSHKVFKASDFLNSAMPARGKPVNEIEELAAKHNIKLPEKELRNRGE